MDTPVMTGRDAPKAGFWAKTGKWLYALTAGRDGRPNEAAIAFLMGAIVIAGLKIYSTICPSHPFNAAEFAGGYATLLSLYNASRGIMGRLNGDR